MPNLNYSILNPAFEVLPESLIAMESNLYCEISSSGFIYFFVNQSKEITGISCFYFNAVDERDVAEILKEIFNAQSVLQKKFKSINVSYSSAESALLTEELYRKGNHETALHLLHGDINNATVLTDLIADKNIYNIYTIPAELHHAITSQFNLATINHQYSLLLKQAINGETILRVIFYQDKIVVTLFIEGKLHLIQTYEYKSAADVNYYLLSICREFNITPTLLLHGVIEKNSDLHKELQKYFADITFDSGTGDYTVADDIKNFPAHYFNYLFASYLCV